MNCTLASLFKVFFQVINESTNTECKSTAHRSEGNIDFLQENSKICFIVKKNFLKSQH